MINYVKITYTKLSYYILGANPLRKVVTSPKSSNFQSYINLLEYFFTNKF